MAISPFIIEANKYEPKMRSALIKAWNELRTQSSRAAIVRALQEGGVEGVMRLVENIEPKIAAQLSPVIDQALGAGASLPATMIPAAAFLNKDVTVSLYNQATVSYLERYKLDLIQQIGSNTREAVRTSLIADQIAGINPVETARNFRNTLGLTAKQEQSVRNYKAYLEQLDKQALQRELRDKRHDSIINRAITDQKPLSPEQIEKMTNRYRERYIKYRSETIARTEALRAVSIGHRAALDQMINNADVDKEKLRRFWHYTGDSRTRQAHREIPGLNKEGRKLDEPFETPLGPLMFPRDPSGVAENTIKCRCVEYYRLILADGKLKGPKPTDEKPKVTVGPALEVKPISAVGSIKNGQKEYESTSDLPLAMGSKVNDLKNPKFRDFLRSLAEDGEKQEVIKNLPILEKFATKETFKLKESENVYFGLAGDKFKNMQVGDDFLALGARSTSFNRERSLRYATDGGVFQLEVPKNTQAVYAEVFDIKELVLLPGSKFKVSEVLSNGDYKLILESDGSKFIKELAQFQKELDAITDANKK